MDEVIKQDIVKVDVVKSGIVKTNFNSKYIKQFIPIIQNAAMIGLNESEIGILLGYTGGDAEKWFRKMRRANEDLKEAWKIGVRIASANLVTSLYKMATGYEYDERLKDGTIRTRYVRPDLEALKLLLFNILPEQFKNTQKVEISKKSLEISSEGGMSDFLNALQAKPVESIVVGETNGDGNSTEVHTDDTTNSGGECKI